MAVVGEPESPAMMSLPDALEICTPFAGPTFRNEVPARAALKAGLNRPTTFAGRLACPILVQVGTNDRVAPAGAARRTARKAGPWAQLREYPVDHLGVYAWPWQQRVLADQANFLLSVLTCPRSPRHHRGRTAPGSAPEAGPTAPLHP
ncbi:hypothetical protein [Streptomyces sp. Tue6028]|uniref:hypothetical protein n=1 Tax=Streptomyces sp. Tue6028 TaxID=2036037 RepID=UPI0015CA17DA|nr:hypothetical protein [Streptomyces sp. Tue6028]